MTGLETASTNYNKSVSDSGQLLTLRDNAFAAVGDAAHKLASGVEKITSDPADLQGGGWDLIADRSPVGQLVPPGNLHATGGDMSGSVDLGPATRRADAHRPLRHRAHRPVDTGLHRQEIEAASSPAWPAGWSIGSACRPAAPPVRATGPARSANARPEVHALPHHRNPETGLRCFFWTAPAKRSGDGAFGRTNSTITSGYLIFRWQFNRVFRNKE